jgi:multidrug efflux pump subunit AcrA (membrane-fusion protein)
VRVDNRGESSFLAGMVATVVFPHGRLVDVTLIPAAALVQSDDGDHVFVVRDGVAERVAVAVVGRRDDQIAVDSNGVRSGDPVIVVGQGVVTDGETVDVAAVR